MAALRRAQLVLVTRVDLVTAEALGALRARIRAVAPQTPIGEVVFAPVGLESLEGGEREPVESLRGRSVLAFAGIGNPPAFFAGLERRGAEVVCSRGFADHHAYAARDLDGLLAEGRRLGVQSLVTTQKDAITEP